MSAPAFAKGVNSGRFSVAGHDHNGHRLFDPDVVIKEYEATADIAELQNHARHLPEGMRGGRPKGIKNGTQQTELFNMNGLSDSSDNNPPTTTHSNDDTSNFLKAKLAKEAYQASLLKMKVETQTGKLIYKSEVQKQGFKLGEIMVGAISSWPNRLAQEFAAMGQRGCDGHDFQHRLNEECNNLIIEIRKRCGYGESVSEERGTDGV